MFLKPFSQVFGKIIAQKPPFSRVTNGPLLNAETQDCSILILLDLSAAFKKVDYGVLINKQRVGVSGTALQWFSAHCQIVFVSTDNTGNLESFPTFLKVFGFVCMAQ